MSARRSRPFCDSCTCRVFIPTDGSALSRLTFRATNHARARLSYDTQRILVTSPALLIIAREIPEDWDRSDILWVCVREFSHVRLFWFPEVYLLDSPAFRDIILDVCVREYGIASVWPWSVDTKSVRKYRNGLLNGTCENVWIRRAPRV